ncbi:MAG: cation:proton antiporter, partial [Pyrinomonadaceae bacterium]
MRVRRFPIVFYIALLFILLFTQHLIFAADAPSSQSTPHGLNPIVLLGVAVILVIAKLGGEVFARLGQPTVLGELISGIVAGNLFHFGFNALEPLKSQEVISALAELGIIIMLFEVGLEARVREMLEVGWSSLLVAIAGIVAPMVLGVGIASLFVPEEAFLGKLFIGATLCATSVGITARVLRDMGRLRSREARIILGAAVIDDVLGLLILAVISGAIQAFNLGSSISYWEVVLIAVKALAFLLGSMLIGHFLVPRLINR